MIEPKVKIEEWNMMSNEERVSFLLNNGISKKDYERECYFIKEESPSYKYPVKINGNYYGYGLQFETTSTKLLNGMYQDEIRIVIGVVPKNRKFVKLTTDELNIWRSYICPLLKEIQDFYPKELQAIGVYSLADFEMITTNKLPNIQVFKIWINTQDIFKAVEVYQKFKEVFDNVVVG